MGLDMYLTKRTYVHNWEHKPGYHFEVSVKRGGEVYTPIHPDRVSYIDEEVAYWRKASQIHRWFVTNCQDGVDDCRTAYVSREQLTELVNTVKQVLASIQVADGDVHVGTKYTRQGRTEEYQPGKIITNPDAAKALLPTQEGFFFGSTDYDAYYVQKLVYTRDTLEAILAEPEGGEFYYHSSW